MKSPTAGGNAETSLPFSQRFYEFVSNLRFVTLSFFLHSIVILLGGTVVLFKVIPEAPDFVAQGGSLVEESAAVEAPPEIVQSSEQELKTDPILGLEVMSASTANTSFVVPTAKMNMDGKAIGDMASKIDGAAKGLAGTGGGIGKVGGMMKFMGVQSNGSSVVFVVDVSGSMVTGQKSVKTYEVLEREVAKFIRALDDRSSFGIVVFSSDAKTFKNNLVRAHREERERAVSWLKKLSPENYVDPRSDAEEKAFHRGTRADRGLAEAFELKPDIIFFVSDGEPTGATPAQILKQVDDAQGTGKKTAVNSVAYLADSGQQFMRALAEKNGGTFREVNPRDVK
jgi:hypothetical protein